MTRLLMPLILLAAAIGLFILYTNPSYQEIQQLQAQADAYDEALNRSQELRAVRDQLLSKRNAFPPEDIVKLERMLPDNVDNIRLIIDINNIAARHGLTLSNVELGEVGDSRTERSASAVGASGDPVGSVTVGFSMSASYEELLAFLADIEGSLRIVDVEGLSFSVAEEAETGEPGYDFSIRTYWLQ